MGRSAGAWPGNGRSAAALNIFVICLCPLFFYLSTLGLLQKTAAATKIRRLAPAGFEHLNCLIRALGRRVQPPDENCGQSGDRRRDFGDGNRPPPFSRAYPMVSLATLEIFTLPNPCSALGPRPMTPPNRTACRRSEGRATGLGAGYGRSISFDLSAGFDCRNSRIWRHGLLLRMSGSTPTLVAMRETSAFHGHSPKCMTLT